ncbi:hypothetical protein [Nonomuraea lactucae]|uniref:hypothetical protein n=1 Tax=Nonomuraea lactucae TaxID=2249762 RepID=UPI000DE1E798|nr:hypothetical protein [Nonomuraea lactucae]
MTVKKPGPLAGCWSVGGLLVSMVAVAVGLSLLEDLGDPWETIAYGLLGVGGLSAAGFAVWRESRKEAVERYRAAIEEAKLDPRERVRMRAEKVRAAFDQAGHLMEELQRDIDAQQAVRDALLAQSEEQERLLEINAQHAEKIRQILLGATEKDASRAKRRDLILFGLGVAVSIPIGVLINLLVP